MSSDSFKFLHSRRMLNTQSAIKKQTSIAKANGVPVTEDHRFAKHHATNCGKKYCIFCTNPRKLFGEKTVQEKSIEQRRLQDEYFDHYEY